MGRHHLLWAKSLSKTHSVMTSEKKSEFKRNNVLKRCTAELKL